MSSSTHSTVAAEPEPTSSTPTPEQGQRVIVPYLDRPILGTVVETEPRPRIDDPDRTIITVAVEGADTTIAALASDAEVPIA